MPRGIPNSQSTDAKNFPVLPNTQRIESGDTPPPQNPPRVLKSTGPADEALDKAQQIVVAQEMPSDEKAAMLAFMNEKIKIRVATNSDPNAEQVFEINVNGRPFFFRRGEVKVVPRYVADWMARRVNERYKHREAVNKEGIKDIVYDSTTSRVYDFSVEEDPNPLGQSWLKAALAGR